MTRRPLDLMRGIPICGVTGVNGAGKTLIAVEAAIADMARGRDVYSTVEIRSAAGNSISIRSLRQLLTIRDATILLDEVAVIFSSRSSQTLPPEINAMLHTLRHSRNRVIWTAPDWMRAEIQLRGATQALLNVVPLARAHEKDNPWPRPRLVMAGLLDTSVGKIDSTPTKVLRRRFIRPRRLLAWGAYDTHADTPMLGRHLQAGRCPDCGGAREVPRHSRERHDELGLPWIEDDEVAALLRASADDAAGALAPAVAFVPAQRAEHGGADDDPQQHYAAAGGDDAEEERQFGSAGVEVHESMLAQRLPRGSAPERGPLGTVTQTGTAPA